MRAALSLAERGRYSVTPNPMVGCVIERNGIIVGRGYHQKTGELHAEIIALREAGSLAKNANVYITLEPCSHHGRTPPCVDALIAAQVKSVHIPFIDPNPLVNGQSITKLKEAKIEVYLGEEERNAKQQNEVFLHYITTQRPYVVAKWAMTLDGKIAITNNKKSNLINSNSANSEKSHWITQTAARQHAHYSRCWLGAVLVGINTVIDDDPLLTPYLINSATTKVQSPYRIILDSQGKVPLTAEIINLPDREKTIIATTEKSPLTWRKNLIDHGITVLLLPEKKIANNISNNSSNNCGKIDLSSLLTTLGKFKISGILVEGGQKTLTSFIAENLVNKIHLYIAPKLIGDLSSTLSKSLSPLSNLNIITCTKSLNLNYEKIETIGNDLFIAATPNRGNLCSPE